jgi:hypothetical protein
MDQNRFDTLTRALAERPSRRRVLQALAGALTASVAAVAGRGVDAAPRCKRVGQACQTSADCCPGDLGNGDVYCASTGKKGKTCRACPSGTVACKGGCVNVAGTDSSNCGACGHICTGGSTCVSGACACPSGQTLCGGSCVDVAGSDSANCGACGHVCAGGSACVAGVCTCGAGQHVDANGACTCAGTACPADDVFDDLQVGCCTGYVCQPNTGQCRACSPAGGSCANGGSGQTQQLCCGTQQCINGICTPLCATDADCDTAAGQTCCLVGGGGIGYCAGAGIDCL